MQYPRLRIFHNVKYSAYFGTPYVGTFLHELVVVVGRGEGGEVINVFPLKASWSNIEMVRVSVGVCFVQENPMPN